MDKYISKDKTIKIINDDCIRVLDEMISRNVLVDCIVCDPAYKTTARGNAGNSGGMLQKDINMKGKVFEHNSCDVEVWMPRVFNVLKDKGHCYIMTNHVNLFNYLKVAQECGFHFIKSLIWKKDNKIMGQYYMNQFEYILFFRKGGAKKINNCGTSDVIEIPNKKLKDENGKNLHDTEKPVDLMKILIENSTQEGELVLDFMCGIGATGIAAKELKRKFIGVEIDNKYYNISKNRLGD